MIEQKDLEQIRSVVGEVIEEKLADVLEITNQGFSDMQKSFNGVNQRVDKLYSLVDGFIGLHQKLDQELTMLRSRIERQETEINKIKTKLALI